MDILKQNGQGYLSLIIGPMFSSKTTQLIELYERIQFCNTNVCVVNYIEDNRYGSSSILTSHQNKQINCISLDKLEELIEDNSYIEKYNIFLINEGQFFSDLYNVVLTLVNTYSKKVVIAGLDGDYLRRPFENITKLIPHCDDLIKLKSLCSLCKDGTLALFSHRITKEKEVKVIGTNNYIPLCRICYNREMSKNI